MEAWAGPLRLPLPGIYFNFIENSMIDRTLLRHIDWVLIFLLIVNSVIGVLAIYSSSHYLLGDFAFKQVLWIIFSLVILFVFLMVDYVILLNYSYYVYTLCIIFLAGILLFGNPIAGTKSWIRFPFFQVQPSELTKIAVIILLAHIFSEYRRNIISLDLGILSSGIVFLPVFLVALQPDLGTALSFLPILLGAMILAGLNKKALVYILLTALIIGIGGWNFFLLDYQKQRIKTLILPEEDPLDSGYHVLQSKIAVGSGGFLGKGYKRGTQSQLRFLPARHTDFVFSVIGEETGFLGVVSVMVIYFLFLARLFLSVFQSRDRAGVYIIFIVSLMMACQFLINVLMTIGLFPIAGIPLPLMSYGGSSLLTNYLAVSLVLNVKMRRFVNV
jgi:rod shape determining protein RodA